MTKQRMKSRNFESEEPFCVCLHQIEGSNDTKWKWNSNKHKVYIVHTHTHKLCSSSSFFRSCKMPHSHILYQKRKRTFEQPKTCAVANLGMTWRALNMYTQNAAVIRSTVDTSFSNSTHFLSLSLFLSSTVLLFCLHSILQLFNFPQIKTKHSWFSVSPSIPFPFFISTAKWNQSVASTTCFLPSCTPYFYFLSIAEMMFFRLNKPKHLREKL